MMVLTAGKKSKINIGEETPQCQLYPSFFIENYFIQNFRLSHSYKVPQLIKIEGFKSSSFKLQSPCMYFFCCTAGLRARLYFPKKPKPCFSWRALQELRQSPCFPKPTFSWAFNLFIKLWLMALRDTEGCTFRPSFRLLEEVQGINIIFIFYAEKIQLQLFLFQSAGLVRGFCWLLLWFNRNETSKAGGLFWESGH